MDINNLWSDYDLNSKKQNSRCLSVNTILEGKYLVGPVLGQGGFGITYVGYDLNMESKIAIKEYFPVELVSRDTTTMHGDRVLSLGGEKSVTYKAGLKKYVAEAQNVSQFSEVPGVVSVKDFFYANETAYIVMEFIDGISLKDYLKEKGGRLTEEETLAIMKPILEALVQVHKSGIIHRDISPDNIMLTFEDAARTHGKIQSVKLIDFGAARMTEKNDQKSLTIILKHGYAPEEQYRTHGEQGPWTDVYALCAVLYRMLTGETPVPAMDRMFKDELKTLEQCGAKVSANTAAAILKGLAVKKDDRIQSVQELIKALYEGVKVTAAKKPKKNLGLIGAGAAVGAAAIIAIVAVSGAGKSDNESTGVMTEVPSAGEQQEITNAGAMNGTEGNDDGMLSFNEDEVGSRIVWTTPEVLLAAGDDHLLSLRDDGTVLAAGENEFQQCDVKDWDEIAAVYSSRSSSAALRSDGTVVVAGNEALNEAVSSWQGIVQLAVDTNYILGLTENGTVVSAGSNRKGSCDTGEWENIETIHSAAGISFGVTKEGELLIAGTDEYYEETLSEMSKWKDIKQVGMCVEDGEFYGLKQDGTMLYTGERFTEELSTWTDITTVVTGAGWFAGLKEDGKVVTTHGGYGQAETWNDIVEIAGTHNNLFGLDKNGKLHSVGASQSKQGSETELLDSVKNRQDVSQAVIVENYLTFLTKDGTIQSAPIEFNEYTYFETPEWTDVDMIVSDGDGIIGISKDCTILREEKSYLSMSVSSLEMSPDEGEDRKNRTPRIYNDWKNIVQISASNNHVAAVLEDGTVKAAGFPEKQPDTDYRTGLRTDGTCDVSEWRDIRQVLAMRAFTLGLKNDGTLVCTPVERYREGYFEEFTGIQSIWGNGTDNDQWIAAIQEDGTAVAIDLPIDNGMSNLAGWTDMIQLAVGPKHIAGLRADGTVLAVGDNFAGQCDVEEWENVVSIAVGEEWTVGVTADGSILVTEKGSTGLGSVDQWPAISINELLGASESNRE